MFGPLLMLPFVAFQAIAAAIVAGKPASMPAVNPPAIEQIVEVAPPTTPTPTIRTSPTLPDEAIREVCMLFPANTLHASAAPDAEHAPNPLEE
jgi:hypothetical protein